MEPKNEWTWQDLIETKDFSQLAPYEKEFVLEMGTEVSYNFERNVLLEVARLNQNVQPRPLILEEKKNGIVVPLYQVIISVAAAFVIGFFLFGSKSVVVGTANSNLAQADTVYIEKRIVDTVIQTKTEYIQLSASNGGHESNQVVQTSPKTNSILSNQQRFEMDLTKTTLTNHGTSAAKDKTRVLMDGWSASND